MDDFFDCVEDLPQCTDETRDDFREQLSDCVQPLIDQDVSNECADAFLPSDFEV